MVINGSILEVQKSSVAPVCPRCSLPSAEAPFACSRAA